MPGVPTEGLAGTMPAETMSPETMSPETMPTEPPDDVSTPPHGTAAPVLRGLADQGFATAPFLAPEAVEELRAVVGSLALEEDHGFFASSNDLDGPTAREIGERVLAAVGPALAEVLPDHEPFLASFLTKGRGAGSSISFHQDLTYTDERRHRTTLVWVPLCDVDARNGAMAVVPGSHRWTDGCRPGGPLPLPTEAHQEALAERSVVVPLRAGEALLYDAGLVHGSGPNPTDSPRPAVGVALAPRGAELVHVHRDEDGGLTAWSVDADFYTLQSLWSRPEGYPRRPPWASACSEDDLRRALERTRVPAPSTATRRVLVDPSADEELRHCGVAVVDLPGVLDVADELLDFYAAEHGLEGQGFEPDLVNPDLGYRERVSDRIAAALDAMVGDLFVDHEPFLRLFLAKWPGPQSDLYLHRDWMYVDERRWGHTFVVWIPLCDVDLTNGPLQVLRGSHLIDDSPRGTDLNAPWLNHHDVVVPRLETVTATLGHAVVMDNALVHSSLPNGSEGLRLVAAVGMRPSGAPLVHFLRADDETAWRFDVDDSFLMTITPQDLMGAPPDLPVVERLAAGQRFWSPDELLGALGEPVPAAPAPVRPAPDAADVRAVPTDQPTATSWWRRLRRRIGVG